VRKGFTDKETRQTPIPSKDIVNGFDGSTFMGNDVYSFVDLLGATLFRHIGVSLSGNNLSRLLTLLCFSGVGQLNDGVKDVLVELLSRKVFTENIKDFILIKIQDQGAGMSKVAQKRVFEKFYREHTGDLHNVKGHGLGLSYVKQIVEDHNGQIYVESEKGKGSTFIIKMPLIN
jgi:signal transduction histidine kinase